MNAIHRFHASDLWRGNEERVVEIVPVNGLPDRRNLWEVLPGFEEGTRPMGDIRFRDGQWHITERYYGNEKSSFDSITEAIEAQYHHVYRRYVDINHEPLKLGAVCTHCGEHITEDMGSDLRCKARR